MNPSHSLFGIIFMLINTLSLSFLDMISKYLKLSMHSSHIVFLYKSVLFLIILPWVFKEGIKNAKSAKLHIHLVRSLLSVAGSLSFIKGLQYVSLADASALENVQYIMLVLFGMLFFKEPVTKTKVFALTVGILGAVIVVKPYLFVSAYNTLMLGNQFDMSFFESEQRGYFGYTLLAMLFWSMNSISVKILGKTEKNKTQMFYLMLFATIWTMPFAFIKWENFEILSLTLHVKPAGFYTFSDFNFKPEYTTLILIMAFCYFVHGVSYFNALKYDLSVVVPFRYTKLLFSAIIGYYLFHETQHYIIIFGYALIVLSGLSLIRYEYKKYKYSKCSTRGSDKEQNQSEKIQDCEEEDKKKAVHV